MVIAGVAAIALVTACRGSGAGGSCRPLASDPLGAFAGRFEIAGHLRDQTGQAIVGAHVSLGGDGQATRTTDFAGGYRFHVPAGSYRVSALSGCSFAPVMATVDVTDAGISQDFTAASAGCAVAVPSNVVPSGEILAVEDGSQTLGSTAVNIAHSADAAAALMRLNDIGAELKTPTCTLIIAGNPAIERQARIDAPGMTSLGGADPGSSEWLTITTAIAIGAVVVRFESQLPVSVSPPVVETFLSAGRAFTPEEIPEL